MTATATQGPAVEPSAEPSQVEMILSRIEALPTLPSTAMRLLELTADDRAGAREVIRVIESDPSVASRLLSVASKASVGAAADTVERAVVLLGFDAVRCLVLSMQVFDALSPGKSKASTRLDLVGLWKHSLAVGCAARLICDALRARGSARPSPREGVRIDPARLPRLEEAFLCGLLHDIGKLALNVAFPKSYDRAVATVAEAHRSISEVERDLFGLDHTLAGRRLATHWGLPEAVVESIWLHHLTPATTPTRIGFPLHVQIVQLADRVARELRVGYSGNVAIESAAELARELGLSREECEGIRHRLPPLIEERAALLGLDSVTSGEIYREALTDANAELARLNASLVEANGTLRQQAQLLEAILKLHALDGREFTAEDVCRRASEALAMLVPGQPVATLAISRARGLAFVSSAGGPSGWRLDLLPLNALGDLEPLALMPAGWLPGAILPAGLADRLRDPLGSEPPWCLPIRRQKALLGLLAKPGESPADSATGEAIRQLSDAAGRLLAGAEAAAQAQKLTEELADINARLIASQTQLTQMRSLGMIGEMAAGAAHELNNPLAVISGRAQMLNRPDAPEDVQRAASLISEHAHRASEIVSELMEFAKPAAPEPSDFDACALLADLRTKLAENEEMDASSLQVRIPRDPVMIRADRAQVAILFDELIRNAIEAMRDVSEPRLVVNCDAASTDDRVVIRIEDNGRGMPPEVLERAATPFFSSRPAGRGRGLGLSRAMRYAEINGGSIRLASEPGRGTTATVELPAAR